MTAALTVTLNGHPRGVEAGASVVDLLRSLGHDPQRPGVAVAVNGEVVGRRSWPETLLSDGDRVELVGAVQGG